MLYAPSEVRSASKRELQKKSRSAPDDFRNGGETLEVRRGRNIADRRNDGRLHIGNQLSQPRRETWIAGLVRLKSRDGQANAKFRGPHRGIFLGRRILDRLEREADDTVFR